MAAASRPVVIMKAALTLDGQLAAADGTSQWITGEEARADAHALRASVDAVLVGAGTVLADDPRLDVRLPGHDGPQPRPVVVAGTRPLPPDAAVVGRDPIVLAPAKGDLPGEVVAAPDETGRRVDLGAGLAALAERGIERVLVEGGAGIVSSLLAAGLIDRGVVYYGAKLAGGVGVPLFTERWGSLEDARVLEVESVRMLGGDVRIEFSVSPPS